MIDLVVEDAQRRIAVECDGDEWHSPDEYEADCIREGIISRCGWQFARIRASSFYAQRVKAIEKLIEVISLHGVRPWCPSEGDASYSAVDIAEVSGADSLRWLGEQVADTAEAGLSQVNVVDSETTTDDAVDDHHVEAVDPTTQQRSLFETEDKPKKSASLPADRIPQSASSVEESSPNQNVRLTEVLACLFQAKEPLTAGQIRWRTKISEDIWPDVERELLQKNLVRKNGIGRRARLEPLDDFLEKLTVLAIKRPQSLKCPECGSDLKRVRFKLGAGFNYFLGCSAYPNCNYKRSLTAR